jgi:hypothetical protein
MFNKRNYNLRTLPAQQYHNLHQQSTNNWSNPLTNNAEYLQCGQIVIQMICQHKKAAGRCNTACKACNRK